MLRWVKAIKASVFLRATSSSPCLFRDCAPQNNRLQDVTVMLSQKARKLPVMRRGGQETACHEPVFRHPCESLFPRLDEIEALGHQQLPHIGFRVGIAQRILQPKPEPSPASSTENAKKPPGINRAPARSKALSSAPRYISTSAAETRSARWRDALPRTDRIALRPATDRLGR